MSTNGHFRTVEIYGRRLRRNAPPGHRRVHPGCRPPAQAICGSDDRSAHSLPRSMPSCWTSGLRIGVNALRLRQTTPRCRREVFQRPARANPAPLEPGISCRRSATCNAQAARYAACHHRRHRAGTPRQLASRDSHCSIHPRCSTSDRYDQ
jgi:hypothetical protein